MNNPNNLESEEILLAKMGIDPFADGATQPSMDDPLYNIIMQRAIKESLQNKYNRLGGGDMYYEMNDPNVGLSNDEFDRLMDEERYYE